MTPSRKAWRCSWVHRKRPRPIESDTANPSYAFLCYNDPKYALRGAHPPGLNADGFSLQKEG